MPALEVDPEEPGQGMAPSRSILAGTYNQTYLIRTPDAGNEEREAKGLSDDSDDGDDSDSYVERRVLFRCGNWCYTGNITLEKSRVLLSDLTRVIPTLQRQQNRLHFYCNASSIPGESSFKEPMAFIAEAAEFAARELASDTVHDELRKWTDVYGWMENDQSQTYFEIQCSPPPCMDGIALAASKTYARGLVFVAVYFDRALYVVVQDGEGDQPLLDVKFPDVSCPGQGIHVATYGGEQRTWLKLALWHSLAQENQPKVEGPRRSLREQPKTTNLTTDSYMQMYTVLKASKDETGAQGTAHHDVLFRFGSWCYAGSVQLTPLLDLADLPHLIPALRMQQSRLDFLCDVAQMPLSSPFAKPMGYFASISGAMETELVAAEGVLVKLLAQLDRFEVGGSVSSWLEGDSMQSFFEFQLGSDKEVDKAFRNVELLAAKTYTATGVVLIAIYFQGTFYVVVGETTGEQPLLDSRFPDVSAKGRGYLVSSYGEGTMAWPQLRKVSIWQTASAMQTELEERGVKASDGDDGAEVHVVTGKPVVRDPLETARMGGEDAKVSQRKAAIVTPSESMASQAKDEAPSRSPMKEEDDEDDKENQDEGEAKAARDRRIDELLRAQPKKKGLGKLGGLSPLGSKVNAPHRIKANDQITEKLAKMRRDLSATGLGGDAPWDEFGRPRTQAFKK